MSEDLVVLREILQRELETINAYEKMLARISDPALREIIDHVTDEEREHVAEMYHLIMDRDPKQRERSAQSHAQLRVCLCSRLPRKRQPVMNRMRRKRQVFSDKLIAPASPARRIQCHRRRRSFPTGAGRWGLKRSAP